MKALILILLSTALLASCAETTIVKPDGTVLVNGGVWTKAKGRAMLARVTMPNGVKVEVRNVTEEPDGVTGPQGALDTAATLGLANALAGERKNASDNDAGVQNNKTTTAAGIEHHKLDNQALEIGGANEVNKIKATPKP